VPKFPQKKAVSCGGPCTTGRIRTQKTSKVLSMPSLYRLYKPFSTQSQSHTIPPFQLSFTIHDWLCSSRLGSSNKRFLNPSSGRGAFPENRRHFTPGGCFLPEVKDLSHLYGLFQPVAVTLISWLGAILLLQSSLQLQWYCFVGTVTLPHFRPIGFCSR
jgi:hypothetical protein